MTTTSTSDSGRPVWTLRFKLPLGPKRVLTGIVTIVTSFSRILKPAGTASARFCPRVLTEAAIKRPWSEDTVILRAYYSASVSSAAGSTSEGRRQILKKNLNQAQPQNSG